MSVSKGFILIEDGAEVIWVDGIMGTPSSKLTIKVILIYFKYERHKITISI
jgi:hypothetical protein